MTIYTFGGLFLFVLKKKHEKSENIQTHVEYPTCVIKLLTQGSRYRAIPAKKSPCEG